jgi:DNA-binding GntR family transcriptional regulator
MERLALGRTPIREALQALARERLVEVYPRRGMFVSRVDVRDLAGLSEVRLTLEPRAARLAAERATDADRATIAVLLKELDHVRDKPDERALIDLDQRIHRHIYECTHNPFLAATLNEYYILTLRIWFLALDRVTRLQDAVREHRELLRAIRARNAERAEEAMRRHVTGFENAIRRVL